MRAGLALLLAYALALGPAASTFVPRPAHAASAAARKKANAITQEAKRRFRGGEFAIARELFAQAAELGPRPDRTYNIARCDEALGNLESAITGYDAYFAPLVLRHRRKAGDSAPDMLLPVSVYDETVPPAAGRAFARALGAPLVAPVHTPVATLPTAATGVA